MGSACGGSAEGSGSDSGDCASAHVGAAGSGSGSGAGSAGISSGGISVAMRSMVGGTRRRRTFGGRPDPVPRLPPATPPAHGPRSEGSCASPSVTQGQPRSLVLRRIVRIG